jgi:hypothetical protein
MRKEILMRMDSPLSSKYTLIKNISCPLNLGINGEIGGNEIMRENDKIFLIIKELNL